MDGEAHTDHTHTHPLTHAWQGQVVVQVPHSDAATPSHTRRISACGAYFLFVQAPLALHGHRSISCYVWRRWSHRTHQVVDAREPRSNHRQELISVLVPSSEQNNKNNYHSPETSVRRCISIRRSLCARCAHSRWCRTFSCEHNPMGNACICMYGWGLLDNHHSNSKPQNANKMRVDFPRAMRASQNARNATTTPAIANTMSYQIGNAAQPCKQRCCMHAY